jgi:hypothetical protein
MALVDRDHGLVPGDLDGQRRGALPDMPVGTRAATRLVVS